jgi:hypothetical protein
MRPTKTYAPRRIAFEALRYAAPGAVLVCFVYLITDDPLKRLGLTVAVVFALGSALYLDVLAGRSWVYLYDVHMDFQGPISHYLESALGRPLGRARIPYQRITSLGRSEYKERALFSKGKGCFLVVQRGTGLRGRKFFIPCNEYEQYVDLKNELLRRVPPGCRLYTWKPFGRKGPF